MSRPARRTVSWSLVERAFCAAFVALRFLHLAQSYGAEVGFDVGAHLERLAQTSWSDFSPDIHAYFYAYHPPLGFLLAHTLTLAGLPPAAAVQMLGLAASLTAFFFLRAALALTGWRDTPFGIVFLYVTCSLPVQLHLYTSINLDVSLLAVASCILYLSLRTFWFPPASRWARFCLFAALVIALSAGMLVKFSGMLLLPLPPLAVLVFGPRPKRIAVACLAGVVACLLVLPYYGNRYYAATGTLLPNNADIFEGQRIEEARAARDADRWGYVARMLTPDPSPETTDPAHRDYGAMRLSDTWRDVWSADNVQVSFMTPPTRAAARVYLALAPVAFLSGIIGWLLWMRGRKSRLSGHDARRRAFGLLLLAVAAVQLAGLLNHMYSAPAAEWRSGKVVYVAPALLALGWMLAHAGIPLSGIARTVLGQRAKPLGAAVVVIAAAAFMFANHLVPVY